MTSLALSTLNSFHVYVVFLALLFTAISISLWNSPHPELGLNTHELLEFRNYKTESHIIVTDDGYQLELIRIIDPLQYDVHREFYPILLLHGFQGSSSVWVVGGNETLTNPASSTSSSASPVPNSLAIALSQHRYDVWLGNIRGNIHSRQHINLDPKSDEFWNFNIDHIVRYDLPAMIDYVRSTTGHERIGYVGHSQANLMLFSLMSTQPRFNEAIKPFIALAPTVFTTKFSAPMALSDTKRDLLFAFYRHDFMTEFLRKLFIPSLCSKSLLPQSVCFKILHSFVGSSAKQLDWNRLPVYLDNLFFGCASNQYKHRLQMIQRGQPAFYNYSTDIENIAAYNQTPSPLYDLSKVNNNFTALIYTDSDWFNHLDDVKLLRDTLKVKLFEDYQVPDSRWNHADLLWAKDAGRLVNSKILEILKRALVNEV